MAELLLLRGKERVEAAEREAREILSPLGLTLHDVLRVLAAGTKHRGQHVADVHQRKQEAKYLQEYRLAWLKETVGSRPQRKRLEADIRLWRRGMGMQRRADRILMCGIFGVPYRGCEQHADLKFYVGSRCGCKYCARSGSRCGQKIFAQLLDKYSSRESVAQELLAENTDWVCAKLDFTSVNMGRMPTPDEVKLFNQLTYKVVHEIERRYGLERGSIAWIRTDEFGGRKNADLQQLHEFGGNTNLHAHCIYVGPRVKNRRRCHPDDRHPDHCTYCGVALSLGEKRRCEGDREHPWRGLELAEMLYEATKGTVFEGSYIVSIKRSDFRRALRHSLEYAGKPASGLPYFVDPVRNAALEEAFWGRRRVEAYGPFRNQPGEMPSEGGGREVGSGDRNDDAVDVSSVTCPYPGCTRKARRAGLQAQLVPVGELEGQGIPEFEHLRVALGRGNVFAAHHWP